MLILIYLKKIRSFIGKSKEYFLNFNQINFLLKNSSKKLRVIFLPSIEYHYPLFQRPQYLAINLANYKDIFLVYLEASNQFSKYKKIEKIKKNFYLCRYFRIIPDFFKSSWLYLVSGQTINTIYDLKKFKKKGHKIIYDYVDEISIDICGDKKAFQFLKERHEFIKKSNIADLVLLTTSEFYDEFKKYYPKDKLILMPNGVDLNIFDSKKNYQIPKDLERIYWQKKPIVGYHGAIAKWLDYEMIEKIIHSNEDLNFVFIGKDYDGSLKKLINKKRKNLFYLGVKNYKELPAYLNYFFCTWIPFKKGDIAKNTSPLKMYESLALKKLVLASFGLKQCYNTPGVYIFKNNDQFKYLISRIKRDYFNEALMKKIESFVKKNSWDYKVSLICSRIKKYKKYGD